MGKNWKGKHDKKENVSKRYRFNFIVFILEVLVGFILLYLFLSMNISKSEIEIMDEALKESGYYDKNISKGIKK